MDSDDNDLTNLSWLHTINILPPQTNKGCDRSRKNFPSIPQSFKCTETKVITKIQSSPTVIQEKDKINRISNKCINIGNKSLEESLKNDTTSPQQVQQGSNSRSNLISFALSHTTKMVSKHQLKPSKEVGLFTSSNISATHCITQPPNVSR